MCVVSNRISLLLLVVSLCGSPAALAADPIPTQQLAEISDQPRPVLVRPRPSSTPSKTSSIAVIQKMPRSERPATHVVKKGDWLSKIAVRYGMSVNEIMDLNGLSNDSIDIGATIRLRPRPKAKSLEVATLSPKQANKDQTSGALSRVEPQATAAASHMTENANSDERGVANGDSTESTSIAIDQPVPAGLTAAQLVGDNSADSGQKPTVSIPTARPEGVNPLSRARMALAIALVLFGLLSLHPGCRSLILQRIPGFTGKLQRTEAMSIALQASRRVGANAQILLLDVEGARLLVGVSEGRMDVLHQWSDLNPAPPASCLGEDRAATAGTYRTLCDEATNLASQEPVATRRQNTHVTAEGAQANTLTPSAEQLLDTWRESAVGKRARGEHREEEQAWWMEGATEFERAVLNEEPVESIRLAADPSAAQAGRVEVEESILETLRNRRADQPAKAQASNRGSRNRNANGHGGFRAAARLGRRPGIRAARGEETQAASRGGSNRSGAVGGSKSSVSFQL